MIPTPPSEKTMFALAAVVMSPRFADPEATSFAKVYVPAVVKLVLEPET